MAEVEDIIPIQYLNKAIDRIFRDIDDFDFEGIYQSEKPIIPQIEECAQTHNISLPTGYKVEIAKLAKKETIQSSGRTPIHEDLAGSI